MKKLHEYIAAGALGAFILAILVVVIFFPPAAPIPDDNPVLPDTFIGTWRRTGLITEDAVFIFREDGTGVSGRSGLRSDFRWTTVDGQVRTIHVGDTISSDRFVFDGETFTINTDVSGRRVTYTYVFYSEATDLYEEERWFFFIIIPFLAIAVAFNIWYSKLKKARPKQIGDDIL